MHGQCFDKVTKHFLPEKPQFDWSDEAYMLIMSFAVALDIGTVLISFR